MVHWRHAEYTNTVPRARLQRDASGAKTPPPVIQI